MVFDISIFSDRPLFFLVEAMKTAKNQIFEKSDPKIFLTATGIFSEKLVSRFYEIGRSEPEGGGVG